MPQVTPNMPPEHGVHQYFSAAPFAGSGSARAPSAAILTGEAGASLVLSRLQSWGLPTQPAMPGVAYDLISDVTGHGLLRIQVKTKSKPTGDICAFSLWRGVRYSKAGVFRYDAGDYDIAAFACLSLGAVFFCPAPVQSARVRTGLLKLPGFDRHTLNHALRAVRGRHCDERASWLASVGADVEPDAPPILAASPETLSPQAAFNF